MQKETIKRIYSERRAFYQMNNYLESIYQNSRCFSYAVKKEMKNRTKEYIREIMNVVLI